MKRIAGLFLVGAILALSLSGCGSSKDNTIDITPLPENNDLSDEKLFEAVQAYIAGAKGPPNSQYQFARIDLNHDGRRDGLVMMNLPHSYWCGWTGCTMLVFKAGAEEFSFISQMISVRGPIVVMPYTTNGWRDIVVRVSGTNMSDKNVAMRFDGNAYPVNPIPQTALHVTLLRDLPGPRFFE